MIEALLHGSCRGQENMEDVLISSVFGMLQYVAPELGLFPFLAEAKTSRCLSAESPHHRLPPGTGSCRIRLLAPVDAV